MNILWKCLKILKAAIDSVSYANVVFSGLNVDVRALVSLALRNDAVNKLYDPAFVKQIGNIRDALTRCYIYES